MEIEIEDDQPQNNRGNRPTPVCRKFAAGEDCPYGASCRFQHVARPPYQPRQPNPCHKYDENDESACPFGDNCRYLHVDSDGTTSAGVRAVGNFGNQGNRGPNGNNGNLGNHGNNGNNGNQNRGTGVARARSVCRFFNSPGGCNKGATDCHFLHVNAPVPQQAQKECRYFSSADGCKRGTECTFAHVKH